MTEPGWYPDPERGDLVRWFDGDTWSEHTQVRSQSSADDPPEQSGGPTLGSIASMAFLGAFIGLMFGGFLFNAIGSLTPVEEQPGTLQRIEIEYSQVGNERTNDSYVLMGATESGEDWRIVDEEAYDIVEAEGYPQPVTVAIGVWTGAAEQVRGETWEVDHQSTGSQVGLGAALGFLVLVGLLGTWITSRAKSTGLPGALVFLIFYFGAGGWLGYVGVQWMQSG